MRTPPREQCFSNGSAGGCSQKNDFRGIIWAVVGLLQVGERKTTPNVGGASKETRKCGSPKPINARQGIKTYYLAYDVPVVRVRPFNHTGPAQSPRFVVPAFASQIARIEAGQQEPVMKVGNLAAARDFSDVRDIVRGYHLAATRGKPGEVYNLASGRAQSIRGLLDRLLSYSQAEIRVERDPARYRPVDVPEVYGSALKFHRLTGWEPEIPFEQTLRDTLEYWRKRMVITGEATDP